MFLMIKIDYKKQKNFFPEAKYYRRRNKLFNKKIRKVMEKDEDPFDFKGLHFIKEAAESKRLNDMAQPCIIISASGMAHRRNEAEEEWPCKFQPNVFVRPCYAAR